MRRDYLMRRVREAVTDSGRADMLISWIDQYVEQEVQAARIAERIDNVMEHGAKMYAEHRGQ